PEILDTCRVFAVKQFKEGSGEGLGGDRLQGADLAPAGHLAIAVEPHEHLVAHADRLQCGDADVRTLVLDVGNFRCIFVPLILIIHRRLPPRAWFVVWRTDRPRSTKGSEPSRTGCWWRGGERDRMWQELFLLITRQANGPRWLVTPTRVSAEGLTH